jgi:hypothetical protein
MQTEHTVRTYSRENPKKQVYIKIVRCLLCPYLSKCGYGRDRGHVPLHLLHQLAAGIAQVVGLAAPLRRPQVDDCQPEGFVRLGWFLATAAAITV